MKKKLFVLSLMIIMVAMLTVIVQAKVIRDAIWCHGELFGVTVTPKDLPVKGKFDILYNFGDSGLEGQRSVSESCPGDIDYNGGRWEVKPVTYTEAGLEEYDSNGDQMVDYELTTAEEVEDAEIAGYVEIGPTIRYFVCPLHPQKN